MLTHQHTMHELIAAVKDRGIPSRVTYQGRPGAFSHMACQNCLPEFQALESHSFSEVFSRLINGEIGLAMVPIENSLGGRVTDVHHLLPRSGLYIVGEYFHAVNHMLVVKPGQKLEDITKVRSHHQALSQCKETLQKLNLEPVVWFDTSGAAESLLHTTTTDTAAIASQMAAKKYGLEILKSNIQDAALNYTRFVIMSREEILFKNHDDMVTSFCFKTRSIPASLYKALGGFATNGVNLVKLESYIPLLEQDANEAEFYVEAQGHSEDQNFSQALEELSFFTKDVYIFGSFKRNPIKILSTSD